VVVVQLRAVTPSPRLPSDGNPRKAGANLPNLCPPSSTKSLHHLCWLASLGLRTSLALVAAHNSSLRIQTACFALLPHGQTIYDHGCSSDQVTQIIPMHLVKDFVKTAFPAKQSLEVLRGSNLTTVSQLLTHSSNMYAKFRVQGRPCLSQ
jgi:hypothetical protein